MRETRLHISDCLWPLLAMELGDLAKSYYSKYAHTVIIITIIMLTKMFTCFIAKFNAALK